MDEVGQATPQRRQFSPAFKAALVRRCQAESVASVALDHAINPVTVHRWIRESREHLQQVKPAPPAFVALHLAAPAKDADTAPSTPPTPHAPHTPPTRDIRIDLQGVGICATATWPVEAADACATWLRAVLQPAKP